MNDSKPFEGKLALVTGASRGIGAATAEALAAAGAHVILTARGASALEQVEERIHQAGGSATIAPMDLNDAENIQKLAQAVAERWGSLDILILNAAMLGSLSPVEHLDAGELERVFKLNVLANQSLIAAFDPLLRRAEKAEIVGVLLLRFGRQRRGASVVSGIDQHGDPSDLQRAVGRLDGQCAGVVLGSVRELARLLLVLRQR